VPKTAPRLSVELLEDRAVPSATPQADISVTNTGQGVVPSGSFLTFTVVVSNNGPDAADGTTFVDSIPGNVDDVTWTSSTSTGVTGSAGKGILKNGLGSIKEELNLPANSSITYLVQGTFETLTGSQITNFATATVGASVTDTNPINNTAVAADTTLGTLTGTPVDITVSTTSRQEYATSGGKATFTFVITNSGTTAVNDIMVSAGYPFLIPGRSPTVTIVENHGASVAKIGSGDVFDDPVSLPAGAQITYTATMPILNEMGSMPQSGIPVSANVTVTLPPGYLFAPSTPDLLDAATVGETANFTVLAPGVTAPPPQSSAPRPFAVAAGDKVVVYNTDDSTRFILDPFPGYNSPVRVATGYVVGNAIPDIVVTSMLKTDYGHIAVFNGETGRLIDRFQTATPFQGGANVAIGDVLGDGFGDIILGSASGVPHIEVFSLATGTPVLHWNFLAYKGFDGGVSVAAGDLNGTGNSVLTAYLGIDDLIAGVASGGPANVYVYDLHSLAPSKALVASFTYQPGYTGGVNVTAGNLGGNVDDILVAPNSAGAGDQVQVYTLGGTVGQELGVTLIDTIAPQTSGPDTGVQISVGAVPGDNQNAILLAPGPGHYGIVLAYDLSTGSEVDSLTPISDYNGAVYVG
jgi:uncharacterized repeat protein (TIGR01451 family)